MLRNCKLNGEQKKIQFDNPHQPTRNNGKKQNENYSVYTNSNERFKEIVVECL